MGRHKHQRPRPGNYSINLTASEPNAGQSSSILELSPLPSIYNFTMTPAYVAASATPFNATPLDVPCTITNWGNVPASHQPLSNEAFAQPNMTSVTVPKHTSLNFTLALDAFGIYNGTFGVNITGSNPSAGDAYAFVNFTVAANPSVALYPPVAIANSSPYNATPSHAYVNITNDGNVPLNLSLSVNASFASLNETYIENLQVGEMRTVDVALDTSALNESSYFVNLTVNSTGMGNRSSLVRLLLAQVWDFNIPTINLEGSAHNATPMTVDFNVTNIGNMPLTVTLSSNASFASLNQTVLSIPPFGYSTVEASLNLSGLSGTSLGRDYVINISGSDPNAGGRSGLFILNVTEYTCMLGVSPSSLSFGTLPADAIRYANLTISNAGTLEGNLTVSATNFTSPINVTLDSNYTHRTADALYSADYYNMSALFPIESSMGGLNVSQNTTDYLGILAPPFGTPGTTYSQTVTYLLNCS